MERTTYRNIQNFLLFLTVFIIGFSFYFQYIEKLEPCPLCIMQRFCAFLFGLLCLFAINISALHRVRIWAVLQIIVLGFGLYFASRQLWLQSLPVAEAHICMPGLNVLIHYFPWDAILKALFWGTSDCQESVWSWLGFSMAAWSACYFALMLVISIFVFWRVELSIIRGTKAS